MADREKLIELLDEASFMLKELCGGYNDGTGNEVRADHLIANCVTVRDRGRWVDAYGIRKSKCTSCGVAFGRVMDADCYYCPNCGAKMDGVGNG